MQCCGRCASSPEILPWCTCDWVTWPKHQHGARVPWLMFYKWPRGLCTTSVPIFPPCCMHSAWDYIPQLQLLPQTMSSCRDDSHLTNPRTLRKIQITGGRKHGFDLLASSVCAGSMLVEDKKRAAWILILGELCAMCKAYLRTCISLFSWVVDLFACQM